MNVQKRRKEQEQKDKEKKESEKSQEPKQEHEWKRESDVEQNRKHNEAYAANGDQNGTSNEEEPSTNGHKEEKETEYQRLLKKYSPQEIALLRSLQHEKDYIKNLKQNDGKKPSPVGKYKHLLSIDEADQFSPDNWIPRSSNLIRLTGKHPLNGEPKLTPLYDAGLVTPNELHYIRNHG